MSECVGTGFRRRTLLHSSYTEVTFRSPFNDKLQTHFSPTLTSSAAKFKRILSKQTAKIQIWPASSFFWFLLHTWAWITLATCWAVFLISANLLLWGRTVGWRAEILQMRGEAFHSKAKTLEKREKIKLCLVLNILGNLLIKFCTRAVHTEKWKPVSH